MDFQPFLRLIDPELYDAIQSYRVTDDSLMPWAYQLANPKGRPLHNDWGIMGKLEWLQPWQKITRMECAYRVPLPFKVTSGDFRQEWMLFDDNYPLSPWMPTKREGGLLYVLTDRGNYGLVEYSAFINNEWRPVFWKYTGMWFGKRLSWYKGLHQDNHVSLPDENGIIRSDLMCWFPELAISWVTEI